MKYRKIETIGQEVSIIGLGTEHVDNQPYEVVESTIHAALDQGINIMDVFLPGEEVRRNIGKAIAGRRDRVMIQGMIGSTDINQQYDISRELPTVKKYFEDLLKFLNTDYIDFGMLFFIDTQEDFENVFESEILTYAQSLKKAGTIRAIGASSHNPVIARKVVETGEIGLLMFSVNPAFDLMPSDLSIDTMLDDDAFSKVSGIEPVRNALYQACERENVAITTMKTLGAGKLLSRQHTPFSAPLSVGQCIQYALDRPAVVSTLIGCKSPEEVAEAVRYLDMTDEELNYLDIIAAGKDNFKGSCVYCNHCQPCPAGIDIAALTKYLDIASLDENNIPALISHHYQVLEAHGSDCIACGSCQERCPFAVPVIDNMQHAAEIFGL